MFLRRGIDDNEGGVFFLENKQSEAFLFTEEFEVVLKMGEKNGEQTVQADGNSSGMRFQWSGILFFFFLLKKFFNNYLVLAYRFWWWLGIRES